MKTTIEVFAENLRRLLDEKQKTQRALAKFVPTTEATVSRWVNAEAMPRNNTMDRVCAFLVCKPEDLLLDNEKTAVLLPEDVIAEEIRENPILFKLFVVAMRATDRQIEDAIQVLKK